VLYVLLSTDVATRNDTHELLIGRSGDAKEVEVPQDCMRKSAALEPLIPGRNDDRNLVFGSSCAYGLLIRKSTHTSTMASRAENPRRAHCCSTHCCEGSICHSLGKSATLRAWNTTPGAGRGIGRGALDAIPGSSVRSVAAPRKGEHQMRNYRLEVKYYNGGVDGCETSWTAGELHKKTSKDPSSASTVCGINCIL
jgi:hypothetical protein